MDKLRFPDHSWEGWAFWIVSSSVFVRASGSSVVVSVMLLRDVALESGKEEVFIIKHPAAPTPLPRFCKTNGTPRQCVE